MRTRIPVIAVCATLMAGIGICRGGSNSETSVPAPQHIVGLQYPRLAHIARIEGRVELEALVSTGGMVKEVKVVSGHALLVDAAKSSLSQWRFTGCTPSSGPCSAKVVFVFVLERGSCDIDKCPSDLQVDLPSTVTITAKQARAIVN